MSIKLINNISTKTSRGVLSKAWYEIDGEKYLVKGNSNFNGNIGYEPYSEVIAYIIAREIGVKSLEYKLADARYFPEVKVYGIKHVSICKEMKLGHGEQRVTACKYLDFMCGGNCINYWGAYHKYVSDIQNMYRMLVFDAIIANEDRHLNNWDIIVKDGKAKTGIIFDNGASLFSWCSESQLRRFKDIGRDKSKPFKETHTKQIQLVRSKTVNQKLFRGQDIKETYNAIINKSDKILGYLPDNRAKIIERCLWNRMNKYLKPFI